jgi:hypothetical protein
LNAEAKGQRLSYLSIYSIYRGENYSGTTGDSPLTPDAAEFPLEKVLYPAVAALESKRWAFSVARDPDAAAEAVNSLLRLRGGCWDEHTTKSVM